MPEQPTPPSAERLDVLWPTLDGKQPAHTPTGAGTADKPVPLWNPKSNDPEDAYEPYPEPRLLGDKPTPAVGAPDARKSK